MWLRKKPKTSSFSSLSNFSTYHSITNHKQASIRQRSAKVFKKVSQPSKKHQNKYENKFHKKQIITKQRIFSDYYKMKSNKQITPMKSSKQKSISPQANLILSQKKYRSKKQCFNSEQKNKNLRSAQYLYYSKETNKPTIQTEKDRNINDSYIIENKADIKKQIKTDKKLQTSQNIKQISYGFSDISTIHKKRHKKSIVLNKTKSKYKSLNKQNQNRNNLNQISSKINQLDGYGIKQGKRKKDNNLAQTIEQKIKIHLQILKQLGIYSQQLIQLYQEVQIWQQLAFLVYKKFYSQRIKVTQFLRKKGKNPFILSVATITNVDIKCFRKRLQLVKTIRSIQNNNNTIYESLQSFYKQLVFKSDEYRMLSNHQYCQKRIFELFEQEINALKQLIQINEQDAKDRIKTVYKCMFLILQLNGSPILTYEDYLKYDQQGNYLQKAQKCFQKVII